MRTERELRLFKNVPIIGMVALVLVAILLPIIANFLPDNTETLWPGYLLFILFIFCSILIILPIILFLFELVINEKLRAAVLQYRLDSKNATQKQIAEAAKKAFAASHLAIWFSLTLYVFYSMFNTLFGLGSVLNYVTFFYSPVDFIIFVLIAFPLIVGNYVFHHNLPRI